MLVFSKYYEGLKTQPLKIKDYVIARNKYSTSNPETLCQFVNSCMCWVMK